MSYRAVLLDVDGTLTDSNDAHAWEEAFTEAGLAVPYSRIRPLIGMSGEHVIEELADLPRDRRKHRALAARRGEIFRERWLSRVTPLPRATSSKADDLEPLLRIADVSDLCEVRVTASDAARGKPDPDILESAIARLGVERSRSVMIGDTPYDISAARRANIDAIGVTTGGFSHEQLAGAIEVHAGPAGLLASWSRSALSSSPRSPG